MRASQWIACVAIGAFVVPGCVADDQEQVKAAREALERCVRQHSAESQQCEDLRQGLLAAERRYEENARRAWGCDPAHPDCPTPR